MKNKKKIQLANKKQHFFNDEENFFYSFELLVTLDFFSADYDKFEPDIYWMIDWLINQYGSISINLCQYNFFADNNIVWIRKKISDDKLQQLMSIIMCQKINSFEYYAIKSNGIIYQTICYLCEWWWKIFSAIVIIINNDKNCFNFPWQKKL